MKYLFDIKDSNRRKYIEDYVISVEKTGTFLGYLFLVNLIVPFLIFKLFATQLIDFFQGYATGKDLLIAGLLFLAGALYAYVCIMFGLIIPAEDKKFIKQVKNGEIAVGRVKILEYSKTVTTSSHINHYYVTAYADDSGNIYRDRQVRAYNYSPNGAYEYGILYYDLGTKRTRIGIIPF
ncbi:MAG: hypothetical protein K6E79_10600 [Pseudobutyrivibrio sp.]|nr:hypothetical protein [Pseudobutyrivibrio sp.]